ERPGPDRARPGNPGPAPAAGPPRRGGRRPAHAGAVAVPPSRRDGHPSLGGPGTEPGRPGDPRARGAADGLTRPVGGGGYSLARDRLPPRRPGPARRRGREPRRERAPRSGPHGGG